jgi:hypothetical protein
MVVGLAPALLPIPAPGNLSRKKTAHVVRVAIVGGEILEVVVRGVVVADGHPMAVTPAARSANLLWSIS